MKRLLFLGFWLLPLNASHAGTPPFRCPGEMTVGMSSCVSQSWQQSDRQLRQKIARDLLKQWQDTTRAVCARAYAPYRDGTIYSQLGWPVMAISTGPCSRNSRHWKPGRRCVDRDRRGAGLPQRSVSFITGVGSRHSLRQADAADRSASGAGPRSGGTVGTSGVAAGRRRLRSAA